jgi:hypothetical protein
MKVVKINKEKVLKIDNKAKVVMNIIMIQINLQKQVLSQKVKVQHHLLKKDSVGYQL